MKINTKRSDSWRLVAILCAFILLQPYISIDISAEGGLNPVYANVYAADQGFSEGFETPDTEWVTTNGVWQIGVPTSGPDGAYEGEGVAGTNLRGDYPADTDSLLISPSIDLPSINTPEEIHLRFQQWFSFSEGDSGQVQIQVYNEGTDQWDAWMNISGAMMNMSPWSRKDIDISAYSGLKVGFWVLSHSPP
jgi:bacillopeptidase F